MVLFYLSIISDGSRQQREGVLHRDASLYDMLAQLLQPVFTV